ncbi:MAG: TetR/AcrR family transcriptional regulator [Acidimicrobiales bacterium]
MERRLTPRGKERRRQLMAAATDLFARQGYHPTSVGDIIATLGVGKGVFYWYFHSKDELFCEILREAQHDLRRRQAQAIGDEPDPLRRIELGVNASMAWSAKHRDLLNLVHFAASEDRFAPVLREAQEVAIGDVVRHLKDGMVAGRIPDADPVTLAHAILGVTGHLARTFIRDRSEPADAISDVAVAFCLGGLLGADRGG